VDAQTITGVFRVMSWDWCLMPLSAILQLYIVAVSFIGWGNDTFLY